jgi:outer membrane protein assembly factor BamB
MKSPTYVSNISVTNRKQTASFRIVSLMLAIAPLSLMLAFGSPANAQTSTTDTSPDWTQFHRDNMQRWNPYETVLGVNNVGNLRLKWKNPIGPYLNTPQSSAAVVNGVAYFGSEDHNVYALDASTGEKLWSYTTGGNAVYSSPAVSNGVVYVGSADGNTYALNASTGDKLWSYPTGVSLSPAVANGVVYTGSVYTGSTAGALYALNGRTGVKLWTFTPGDDIGSSPVVIDGVVYVSTEDGTMYALNAITGFKLWTSGPLEAANSSPAVANGIVYFGSGNVPGEVYALNGSTGTIVWTYVTGLPVFSSPAVANGVVYIGSADGNLHALNAGTGAELWSYYTASTTFTSSPAVANGVVYVSSDNELDDTGTLYAVNASTGVKLWSYAAPGFLVSSPTIVDGTVYFRAGDYASERGNTYAFSIGADLFLRINPSTATVHQGDLLTYAFPVWNLGPANADFEVLNTQVPAGTTFDYIRISGTKGLGTCTTPPYEGTGEIVCHENSAMAPNTTWTVRVTVKVTAPAGTVITESATTTEDTFDPNAANNTATVSTTVQ